MDVSRRRRASVDSILPTTTTASTSSSTGARDGSFTPIRTRKTVSLTLCVISTEDTGAALTALTARTAPLPAAADVPTPRLTLHPHGSDNQLDADEPAKKEGGEGGKGDKDHVKHHDAGDRKKSPIEKFREKCDKLESLLHWGRHKKDKDGKKSMSVPPAGRGRPEARPPSPPAATGHAARPASPPTAGVHLGAPPQPPLVGHLTGLPSPPTTTPGGRPSPSRPTSLSLPQSQMVIGGSAAPEPRRGSLNHGDLFHDIPDEDDDAFRALDLGPQVRPYAVGAPLKAPRPLPAGGAAAGTVLVHEAGLKKMGENDYGNKSHDQQKTQVEARGNADGRSLKEATTPLRPTSREFLDNPGQADQGKNKVVGPSISAGNHERLKDQVLSQTTQGQAIVTTPVSTAPTQAFHRQATVTTSVSTGPAQAIHRPATVTTSESTTPAQATHRSATGPASVSTGPAQAIHRPATVTTPVSTAPAHAIHRSATVTTSVSTAPAQAIHRPTSATTSMSTSPAQAIHRPATVTTSESTAPAQAIHRSATGTASVSTGPAQAIHRPATVTTPVSTAPTQAIHRHATVTTSMSTAPARAIHRSATVTTLASSSPAQAIHRPATVTTSVSTSPAQAIHRPATVTTSASSSPAQAIHRPATVTTSVSTGPAQATHGEGDASTSSSGAPSKSPPQASGAHTSAGGVSDAVRPGQEAPRGPAVRRAAPANNAAGTATSVTPRKTPTHDRRRDGQQDAPHDSGTAPSSSAGSTASVTSSPAAHPAAASASPPSLSGGSKAAAGRTSSGPSVSFASGHNPTAGGVSDPHDRDPPRPRSPYPRARPSAQPTPARPRSRTPTPPRPRTPTPCDTDAASSSSSSCADQVQLRRHVACSACTPRPTGAAGTALGECSSCSRAGRAPASTPAARQPLADTRRSMPPTPRSSGRSAPIAAGSGGGQHKRAQSASPARRKAADAGDSLRNSLVHLATRNSQPTFGRPQRVASGPYPSPSNGRANSPRVYCGLGFGTAGHSENTPLSPVSSVPAQAQAQGQVSPGWDVVALEMEVLGLRRELQARRAEELRLRREIHKLRSVLQQATSFSQDGDVRDEDSQSPGGGAEAHDGLLTSLQARHAMAGAGDRAGGGGNGPGAAPGAAAASACPPPTTKKQGVSGESSDPGRSAVTQTTFPKDFRSQQLIKAAILDNDFLKNLSRGQIRELVDCMYPQSVTRGSYVIREGDAGCHLYVLAEGEMEVLKEGTVLGRTGPGKAFGELAILYNCTRTASIRAVTDLQVWVLDRKVFQQIMMRTGMQRIEENLSFLSSVPLLSNLAERTLHKIADVLEVEFYPAGSYIVRQGATGHTFFIISGGTVQVTQRVPGSTDELVIRTLGRGDYFGEQALLHDDFRTASVVATAPGVECLTLDRESFLSLIGSLSELQEKDYGDGHRHQLSRTSSSYSVHSDLSISPMGPGPADVEVEVLRLEDLQVVGTLGVGGFGSVRLVVVAGEGAAGRSYALKCLNKNHIVATGQQEHVLGEKDILTAVHCPFIVRLYRTFRDDRCVYMLLEACLGGELWSMLRDRGSLDEEEARFAVACVVQAVEYLHARRIIYRDLKPENLVLDARGYVKLVDFGFAKRLVDSNKTWTFCGTPEYVAPEVILNRGHDRAVDCWAIGVLIFELLTGAPPFTAADPMRTYNLILKGIEAVAMPRAVTRAAAHLVRRLCKAVPAERLGYQRAGLHDVRQHKWFQGFDWEGLAQQTLQPPITPQVSGPTDMSNFETCNKEEDMATTEFSLWEADF